MYVPFRLQLDPSLARWCSSEMQRLTGNSDIVRVGVHVGVGCHLQPDVSFRFRLQDLLQFCATLDSPATVRAYLRDYLVSFFQVAT